MGKDTLFTGQPMLSQLAKLLDKHEVLRLSRSNKGERYIKSFDGWQHLMVSPDQCHDNTYQPKLQHSKPVIPCVLGVSSYIILSLLTSTLFKSEFHDSVWLSGISEDLQRCSLSCLIVMILLVPSFLDAIIGIVVMTIIGKISWMMCIELGFATAVIVFLTHFSLIIVAAIRRSDAINNVRNNNLISLTLWKRILGRVVLLGLGYLGILFALL